MQLVRGGDGQALQILLTELAPVLRRLCKRALNSPEDAEEVTQECLLLIYRYRAVYDPTRSFSSWVYAITRNKLADHFRKRTSQEGRLNNRVSEFKTGPVTSRKETTYNEDRLLGAHSMHLYNEQQWQLGFWKRLKLALESLSSDQRDAIYMTKVAGFSVKEAAEKAGISESSLKIRVFRGLKLLRRKES